MAIVCVVCAAFNSPLFLAVASADPHNPHTVTYTVKVDAPISGARVIYMVNDTYTATAPLSATGREFTTNTMLADSAKAGMQVSIPPPFSGNVHCEINVDGQTATLVDQFVASSVGNGDGDPNSYGVLGCGASPLPVPLWWAKLCDAWWCTDTSYPSDARDRARVDATRDSDPDRSPSYPRR
ncbi:MAG: hypothetical protein EKK34_09520 [Mycobacterium sp.]|nr:MAG: hypothetical protein EKK34_09520 [Mycobacterium sp.]